MFVECGSGRWETEFIWQPEGLAASIAKEFGSMFHAIGIYRSYRQVIRFEFRGELLG
jgi:hypothetical protein